MTDSEQQIDWDALRAAARGAREQAYAPYSRFSVGAALLGEDGRIYLGANVENASYPLSLCAERSAVAAAVTAGCRKFLAIAVWASGEGPTPPCGGCRQVLAEFAPALPVRSYSDDGEELVSDIGALLPRAFGPDDLA